jgi:hypothetical protein
MLVPEDSSGLLVSDEVPGAVAEAEEEAEESEAEAESSACGFESAESSPGLDAPGPGSLVCVD